MDAIGRKQPSDALSGELALVESIRKRAARAARGTRGLRLGMGDDCAILRPSSGHEICVTTDFSLEGVHFRRDWHPAESVGHRCLARGLSDLAAMGAEPLGVFLSIALPAQLRRSWLDRFFDGFLALAQMHSVPLAGGDTAQSPGPIVADIVAVGQVPKGQALLRSGARAGDALYVTGALGGAAAELRALEENPRRFRSLRRAADDHPHFFPSPRLAVGRRLRNLATAAIDISDGLSTDLMHLCEESQLAAVVEAALVPVHSRAAHSPRAAGGPDGLELALHGGEDYELLFTAPSAARLPAKIAGVPVWRIGTMERPGRQSRGRQAPAVRLKTLDGRTRPLAARGWEHFRAGKVPVTGNSG